jgi:hypothetical protein
MAKKYFSSGNWKRIGFLMSPANPVPPRPRNYHHHPEMLMTKPAC